MNSRQLLIGVETGLSFASALLSGLSEIRISPAQLFWQGIAAKHAGRYSTLSS